MQSGYGVPEIQQFMVDSCCSSLLSISHESSHPQKHLQQQQNHQQQQQQQQQRLLPFHPFPITQHFFQQNYQFQAFQQQQQRRLHQQLGLEQEPGPPENLNSPSGVVGPFITANFKLAVNENSSGHDPMLSGSRGGGGEDDSESRAAGVAVLPWQHREEDSAIKEPFWKPFDIEFINKHNKRCKEKVESPSKLSKKGDEGNENEEGKSSASNFGLFGELEAIYAHGSSGGGGNTQAGSGSALTGDNHPTSAAAQGPTGGPRSSSIDHGSETSAGEEASLKKLQKIRRRKKRKQMSSIAAFFETLVKQLIDHQESLHQKFLEVMERRDQERMDREENWRQQEAEKSSREAMARAQEQAIAASREAAIVSFLEKITGESINLPTTAKTQFSIRSQFHEESQKEENHVEQSNVVNTTITTNENTNNNNNNNNNNINSLNTRRWPKAEVQALIRVRSGLESRFQEPGLKGPLWEEVSSSMAALGYQRSSKRCKEKWENINKYFRKTKDSAKKRSQHSKTCPYFHQLDQLYSKSLKPSVVSATAERKDNSELLDSIVVPTDPGSGQNPNIEFVQEQLGMHSSFKFHEMGSVRLDFCDGNAKARNELFGFEQEEENEDEEDEEGEDDEDEEEGEGEGENQEHVREEHPQKSVFFSP
ncbi:trihelix transcription factor DF1-like [Magnolia sinica]|uniref:trihelix transcription factor DF1-like n=1 Tax=Magnolia sinica TaxID=86752 RepID=UPI00265B357A|nr:trihelix transcription factor DF1-like [Magnolia sinica]